jgi:hypothetical protein
LPVSGPGQIHSNEPCRHRLHPQAFDRGYASRYADPRSVEMQQ